jgi:hypothetical protein
MIHLVCVAAHELFVLLLLVSPLELPPELPLVLVLVPVEDEAVLVVVVLESPQ